MSKNLLIYIAKCVTGTLIVFLLAFLLNSPDYSWCLISVILVITPESSEAVPLAVTRIKANFIGGVSSIACLLLNAPLEVTILIAMIIAISVCYYFNLMTGSRAAIAAVIIILMHGIEYHQPHFWDATLKRFLMVVVGCAIGMLVTLAFHRKFSKSDSSKAMEKEFEN